MAQINFPTATANGQEFEADNGVIYTYVGTPPNGYWSGTFQSQSYSTLDNRYLKLDSSNDPVTGGLNITGGDVGIGTNNPSKQLDVHGSTSIRRNTNDNQYLQFDCGSGGNFITSFSPSDNVKPLIIENDNTSGYITVKTGGSERIRILSDGDVGIGTNNPSASLHVSSSNAGQSLRLSHTDVASYYSFGRDSSGNLRINDSSTGEIIRIQPTGNIGIGTTNPSAKLTVSDPSGTGNINLADLSAPTAGANQLVRLIGRNAANSGTTSVDFFKTYQSGFGIHNNDTDASNFTRFVVGASERMRIDSSGNVGIGVSDISSLGAF